MCIDTGYAWSIEPFSIPLLHVYHVSTWTITKIWIHAFSLGLICKFYNYWLHGWRGPKLSFPILTLLTLLSWYCIQAIKHNNSCEIHHKQNTDIHSLMQAGLYTKPYKHITKINHVVRSSAGYITTYRETAW